MQCVQSIVGVIIQECKRQNLITQTKVFNLKDTRYVKIFSFSKIHYKSGLKGSKLNDLMVSGSGLWFNLMSEEVRFFVRFWLCTPGLHGRHRICKARPAQESTEHRGLLKVSYYAKQHSFMTFFICPQTIVNSWFTAWNFSINNVNESLNIKHDTLVIRLWTVELLDIN